MCAVVGYNYASMECGIKHSGYSAPLYVSYFYVIPYLFVILITFTIGVILLKKDKQTVYK